MINKLKEQANKVLKGNCRKIDRVQNRPYYGLSDHRKDKKAKLLKVQEKKRACPPNIIPATNHRKNFLIKEENEK